MLRHFYPRPPRGGRPFQQMITDSDHQFLSTPSARRATPRCHTAYSICEISIHALREEGDAHSVLNTACRMDFYPRPP